MARNIDDWEVLVFEGPKPVLVEQGHCVVFQSKKANAFRYEVFGEHDEVSAIKGISRYVKARGTENNLIDLLCELAMLNAEWNKSSQNTK